MKKILSTLLIVSSFSTVGFSKGITTISDKLKKAQDFEYIHCKSINASAGMTIKHFIVDIRNSNINGLYMQIGAAELSAQQLNQLQLIDKKLTAINADSSADVSFVSTANKLKFSLIIQDTDGQLLDGKIISDTETTDIRCKDVTLK